jgi:hypothetical protein
MPPNAGLLFKRLQAVCFSWRFMTIKRLENPAIGASADTQRRVQETFEAAGVQWIGTTGVKLARRRTKGANE